MIDDQIFELAKQALILVLLLSAPALVASLAAGFLMSFLQAATQLQDQTLTFVPKLIVVFVALIVGGGWMGANLIRFTRSILSEISLIF